MYQQLERVEELYFDDRGYPEIRWSMIVREKLFPLQHQCTALLLAFNLAQHKWIDVTCEQFVRTTLVCQFEDEILLKKPFLVHPPQTSCGSLEFKKQNTCYVFIWLTQSWGQSHLQLCHRQKLEPFVVKDISYFSFIFNAVGETTFDIIVDSPHALGLHQRHTFERIWQTHLTHQNLSVGSLPLYFICVSKLKPVRLIQGNLYTCPHVGVISSMFVLDGFRDCPGEDMYIKSSDEMCPFKEVLCPRICEYKKCSCSPIQYKARNGFCKTFVSTMSTEHKTSSHQTENENRKTIHCHNSETPLHNNVQHCSQKVYRAQENSSCLIPGHHKCGFGDSSCYHMSDICIYKLNNLFQLTPYPTGSHLQNCLHFECNIHFQCPSFYCIPWLYVCDGIYNCPYGYDEHTRHLCGTTRICINMLRCRKSQLCVDMSDICNHSPSCPLKDDELLCEISNLECPADCTCVNFAISCHDTKEKRFDAFISYHITNSSLKQIHIFSSYERVLRLHCVGNELVEICGTTSKLASLVYANFASNK